MRTTRTTILIALLAGLASGCRSVEIAAEPIAFPALKQSKTLDIQVVRDGTHIRLSNTTATPFGASRLWLNRRFSLAIGSWAIGQTLDLPLSDFRDEFGERFRAGGFFAAEAPDTIVQAQLQTPLEPAPSAALLGLIVVPRD